MYSSIEMQQAAIFFPEPLFLDLFNFEPDILVHRIKLHHIKTGERSEDGRNSCQPAITQQNCISCDSHGECREAASSES